MYPLMNVTFCGWLNPQEKWKTWVNELLSEYEYRWKKAGIYKSIMGSTYEIQRDTDLVLGLAEKWCSKTNSFMFSWGAARIMLEDIIILGGYSVFGFPAFSPIKSRKLKEIEAKLEEALINNAEHDAWIRHFMENKSQVEHEAFLSLWLSRYVFPCKSISKCVFPIAIQLARGTRIALAQAVLASIYRDLGLLKENIVNSMDLDNDNDDVEITVWAPLQLVQIWAWKRFVKLDNVNSALEYSGQWHPYAVGTGSWPLYKLYNEKEKWVLVDDTDLQEELELARCLQSSQLDFKQQYLPQQQTM